MVYFLAALVMCLFVTWAGSLVLLLARKTSFKQLWEQHNSTPYTDQSLLYVALGDSTAQGLGAPRIQQSYPWLVRIWLQKQTGRQVKLVNLSVSGATAQDVLQKQMSQLYRLPSPHVVTLAIGANDLRHFNAERFEETMLAIVRTLPKETYIATLPSFSGRAKKQDWKSKQATDLLLRLLKGTNHHVVDLRTETKRLHMPWHFAADWFHPNARAYKRWAVTFEKSMAEQIPELTIQKR